MRNEIAGVLGRLWARVPALLPRDAGRAPLILNDVTVLVAALPARAEARKPRGWRGEVLDSDVILGWATRDEHGFWTFTRVQRKNPQAVERLVMHADTPDGCMPAWVYDWARANGRELAWRAKAG